MFEPPLNADERGLWLECAGDLDRIVGPENWNYSGSRIIESPAKMGTDLDIVVLIPPGREGKFDEEYFQWRDIDVPNPWESHGGSICDERGEFGGVPPRTIFLSLKQDFINLIITRNPDFYQNFMIATSIARFCNLREKKDRIDLFQHILYGAEAPPCMAEYLAIDQEV